MKFKLLYAYLLLLCLVSLFFRLYHFRQGETFVSSDEVFLFAYAVKPVYAFFHPNLETISTQLFRFFNFGWGWGNLFFGTIFFFFYKLFNIPFTEFTINLPYIFVGTGSVILAFFVGKELRNSMYGFIVGFLLAILPTHIAFSRSIGLNSISGLFGFLLTLYLFIKYFKTHEKKYQYLGYLSLGYYIISENQALGILPVLLFVSYVYTKPLPTNNLHTKSQSFFKRLFISFQNLFSFFGICLSLIFLLPTLLGALYLASKGMLSHSYLNIFHSKPIILNIYWEYVLDSFLTDIGLAFTLLLLSGLVFYFILVLYRWKSQERLESLESLIPFVWFFIYTIPWFFLVVPSSYELRLYNTYTLSALVFLTGYALLFILEYLITLTLSIHKRLFLYGISGICLFGLLAAAFLFQNYLVVSSTVYRQDYFGVHMPSAVFGFTRENTGIKTIGYYIRENLPSDAVIFVDVESFVGAYYFQRPLVGDLDLNNEQIHTLLLSSLQSPSLQSPPSAQNPQNNMTYAFITKDHFSQLGPLLEDKNYRIIATALDNDEIEVGRLYRSTSVSSSNTSLSLPISKYDILFNSKYGTLDGVYVDYG